MNWKQFALFFVALIVLGIIAFQQTDNIRTSCQENRNLIVAIEKDLAKARNDRGEVGLAYEAHQRAKEIENNPC